MKKLLPLILLSLAATVSGTAAAVAGPSVQPDGAPDYAKYITCRENGGYTVDLADGTTKCVPFETTK